MTEETEEDINPFPGMSSFPPKHTPERNLPYRLWVVSRVLQAVSGSYTFTRIY